MQAFSNALANLYDLASGISPHDFPVEALRLLRTAIACEAAVMRIGEIETAIEQGAGGGRTLCQRIDRATFVGRAPVCYHEQALTPYLRNLPRPLIGTRDDICSSGEALERRLVPQKYEFQHFLLFGVPASPAKPARWLVMYRDKTGPCFNAEEATLLQALWKHLMRAITINLQRILREPPEVTMQCASAVIDSRGIIEAGDEYFAALMALEWPGEPASVLPARVVASLQKKSSYCGKAITISTRQSFGYMVCTISRNSRLTSLSPCEHAVAERFASGSSYKTIARQLDMSPYTVRNHIAHVYQKLGINNKASLASQVLAANTNSPYRSHSRSSLLETDPVGSNQYSG
jgi:DNA-binding CsgD family transcriptional regulator